MIDDDYNRMSKEMAPEAKQLWPTLTDFLLDIHGRYSTGSGIHIDYFDSLICNNWRWFEPRRVCAPGGYMSHKCVGAALAAVAYERARAMAINKLPQDIERTATAISHRVMQYKVPVYYVAEPFARAVAATELPDDLFIDDLKLPMPGMVIGWPQAFMREYLGGADISYIYCATVDVNEDARPPVPELGPSVYVDRNKIAWWHFLWSGSLESFVSSYWRDDLVKDFTSDIYTYTDYTGQKDRDKVVDDKERSNLVSALMLKLLLLLSMNPAYITTGGLQRKAKVKKGRTRDELWSPSMIGVAYRSESVGPGTGTHASPRVHFRRGHITHVAKMKKDGPWFSVKDMPRTEEGNIDWPRVTAEQRELFWACHKRRWIKPVLINP
jgi:hypothetical protein